MFKSRGSPYELFAQLAPLFVEADFRLRLLDEGDVGCIGKRALTSVYTRIVALQASVLIAMWWQNHTYSLHEVLGGPSEHVEVATDILHEGVACAGQHQVVQPTSVRGLAGMAHCRPPTHLIGAAHHPTSAASDTHLGGASQTALRPSCS